MEFNINPVPPFSFDLSAGIFGEDDERIHRYENGRFWQVIRPNGKLVLVALSSSGTVDDPELSASLMPDEDISGDDIIMAGEILRDLFNTNLDLLPFYEAIKGDRVMATITQLLRGLRNPSTTIVFEALVDSIVEQQISLKVPGAFNGG